MPLDFRKLTVWPVGLDREYIPLSARLVTNEVADSNALALLTHYYFGPLDLDPAASSHCTLTPAKRSTPPPSLGRETDTRER